MQHSVCYNINIAQLYDSTTINKKSHPSSSGTGALLLPHPVHTQSKEIIEVNLNFTTNNIVGKCPPVTHSDRSLQIKPCKQKVHFTDICNTVLRLPCPLNQLPLVSCGDNSYQSMSLTMRIMSLNKQPGQFLANFAGFEKAIVAQRRKVRSTFNCHFS